LPYVIILVKSVNFIIFIRIKNTFFDSKLFIIHPTKYKKDINMSDLIEILKYTLPALIVFVTSYLLIRMNLQNEEKRRRYEMSRDKKESILPLRLQAYERLILFLERIAPEALVMRVSRQDLNVNQTLNELVSAIRTEFEHNLVQQTYISSQGWDIVKTSKNNMIKLITEAAKELKPAESGILLSRQILQDASEMTSTPVMPAIEYLKKEVRELF
jgi:hypothetical protein